MQPDPVIIVTGAATGIGQAVAIHLAQQGARVVIADLHEAPAAAAALCDMGLQAEGFAVDVSDETQVEALAAQVLGRHGRIDVLVNNAGIYSSLAPKPFEALTVADWQRVLAVNVVGVFLMCRAVAPAMRQAGAGSIINISSGVAFKGNPLMAHYVASKGAVVSLTRALATELGKDGVRVNSVAPGFTLSESVQRNAALVRGVKEPSLRNRVLARDMMPDDLVGAVAFFASPASAFITGQTLVVDGGAYYH